MAVLSRAVSLVRAPSPSKVFYGWWIVGAGVVIQALVSGLFMQAYGAYVVLLRNEFGWSKTVLSAAYSMSQAESGVAGPVQGWLTDRFGPRAVIRAGLVILGIGLVCFSMVQDMLTFFLAFVVIAVGVSLSGFLSLTVAVVNWFERRRATALGMLSIGVALGGFSVPLTVWGLESLGWRTMAVVSAGLITGIGLVCAQFIRGRPEDYGMAVDGARPALAGAGPAAGPHAPRTSARPGDFTVGQAMRTRQFWFISFGHGAALLIVSAVTVHLVAHVHENLGYSLGQASFVITVLTMAQVVGTLSGGALGDRFNKRLIATFCMFIHAGALLLLAFATTFWMVMIFAVFHGWAWGTRGPLMAAIRADYFGRGSFGAIMGASQPIIMVGMTGGPILAGYLADRTGNYESGFTILAALAAVGSVFFILATKPAPRPAATAD